MWFLKNSGDQTSNASLPEHDRQIIGKTYRKSNVYCILQRFFQKLLRFEYFVFIQMNMGVASLFLVSMLHLFKQSNFLN